MNIKKPLTTIFSLITLVLQSACVQASGSPQLPIADIVSLKGYLPQIEQVAREWRSDAVPIWFDIPIQYNGLSMITAAFRSPTVQEGLLVYLKPDGKIETEKVKHETKLNVHSVDGWKIDSPEAFKLLLNENGRKYLASEEHRKGSSLSLKRVLYLPEQPLVWRLTLTEFGSTYVEHYYLDAISGERLYDLDK